MARKTKYKRYYLGDKYPDIYFTNRESQFMQCFIAGFTNIETAHILNLSDRTVESYLKKMKEKLFCRTKQQLIEKVDNSEFVSSTKNEKYPKKASASGMVIT